MCYVKAQKQTPNEEKKPIRRWSVWNENINDYGHGTFVLPLNSHKHFSNRLYFDRFVWLNRAQSKHRHSQMISYFMVMMKSLQPDFRRHIMHIALEALIVIRRVVSNYKSMFIQSIARSTDCALDCAPNVLSAVCRLPLSVHCYEWKLIWNIVGNT